MKSLHFVFQLWLYFGFPAGVRLLNFKFRLLVPGHVINSNWSIRVANGPRQLARNYCMMSAEIGPDFQFPSQMEHSALTSSAENARIYRSSRPIYSFDWSPNSSRFCSLAVGSFVTEARAQNGVDLVSLTDPQMTDFQATNPPISLQFPITKVQYSPHNTGDEVFGVSGDGLRIYRVKGGASGEDAEMVAKLIPAQISTSPTSSTAASRRPSDANIITSANAAANSSTSGSLAQQIRNSPAPITSFDWNRVDSNLLVTSSYDTTCAVWNLTTASVKTQLIAHDKEVYDVAFNPKSADIFASVGAEGSIRLFDTRSLDHSTILYETGDAQPLLRLAWNPLDNNYVACFGVDSQQVVIVDVRSAAVPVAILNGHSNISSLQWAPHNSGWMAVGDAGGIKLWDVSVNVQQPTWHLPTTKSIQNMIWPTSAPDWMAFSTNSVIQAVKL